MSETMSDITNETLSKYFKCGNMTQEEVIMEARLFAEQEGLPLEEDFIREVEQYHRAGVRTIIKVDKILGEVGIYQQETPCAGTKVPAPTQFLQPHEYILSNPTPRVEGVITPLNLKRLK